MMYLMVMDSKSQYHMRWDRYRNLHSQWDIIN